MGKEHDADIELRKLIEDFWKWNEIDRNDVVDLVNMAFMLGLDESNVRIQELEAENKKMREALQDVEGLSLVLIKELEKLK